MAALEMIVVEAAAQIVSQKLEILLSHPVCAECVSKQANKAKMKLFKILEFISTQYRPPKTTEWSGRLHQALYHAEKFMDKFYLREARERHESLRVAARPLPTLVSKYKLWRDLSELVSKMEELCDEKFLKEATEGKRKNDSAGSSSHPRVSWQGTKLARLTGFWDRHESIIYLYLKEKRVKLMTRIQSTQGWTDATSILGMPGTGKTFLARWAHGQAKYMGYERAWVHMWADMDKKEFLFEILQQVEKLAREMKDMEIDDIKAMLHRKLAVTKRLLLVLDEVKPSNDLLLRELAMIIPPEGLHVICTTGDEEIARYVFPSDKGQIRLEQLPEVESEKMLAWKLHRVDDGKSLTDQEKNILHRCPPLPRCISLIGGILSNATENERAALAQEGSITTLPGILELSCHKLPAYLKPCFIYMALFPVTFPIPTRRLVRLWLAEGLLDSRCYDMEKERTRQPEDVGEMFILELANRNVIDVVSWRADGSPKACHMVVHLHEMIWPIATSMGYLHVHAPRSHDPTSQQQQSPAQQRIRWLAEHTNIVRGGSYPEMILRHVTSFLSFYLRKGVLTKDISTFLGKMTSETDYSLLRVLDLEGVYKPSLQGVLHKLVLLRYLGLRSTVLDSLPSTVADLHLLETLDIKHTNITSLPSSLWKMRNLRHLHLNWFYIDLKTILKALGNNLNALTQLQTLSGLVVGEVMKSSMTGYMHSLTTLTTLKLFLQRSGNEPSGAAGKTVADWISFGLINLQSLTFGVIQEAMPDKEDKPEPTKEATKVPPSPKEDEPKEDGPPKGDELAKEAQLKKQHKPTTSKIGPLPELSLAEKHRDLLELYLLGQLNKPNWTQLLPGSLRVLTLSGSKVEADMMSHLGDLLKNLRTLRLLANSFRCESLTFAKDGFPSLKILKIWKLPDLKKVKIEKGAMLQLKELELRYLDAMKGIEGIKECGELENIYVVTKKGAMGFVDNLENDEKQKVTLYKIEDPETSEFTEDDERFRV